MITAHAGWTLNPISNPNPTITHSLPLASSTYSAFGDAVDSTDPSATFTFSWSVLLPRTGQTADFVSATAQNPTLQNVTDTWGDIRLFLIAVNPVTGDSSDADPRTAPASAFCTLQIESAARSLRLPAIGSRDWYTALDSVTSTLDTLSINNGIDTATVNGSGELIITLDDGSTINAGSVIGPAGADGADGADGAAGPSQRQLMYSAHVTHWYDSDAPNVLRSEFNPAKLEPIAGPWRAPVDLALLHISITARNAGTVNNAATFNIYTCTPANWEADTLTSDTQTLTITSVTSNEPSSTKRALSPAVSVPAGSLFGIQMGAPSIDAMHSIAVSIQAQEA